MSTTIDGSASVTINSGAVLGITSGTAVASTSGTSIDFTSIPSWVKRITVMLNGVSTNGTSGFQVQIGSGSIDATNYKSVVGSQTPSGSALGAGTSTTGFYIFQLPAAATTVQGVVTLSGFGANVWVGQSACNNIDGTPYISYSSGSKTLSGTLDRVRITTVNGTDTFDAGSINILYE